MPRALTLQDLALLRLRNQQLLASRFTKPEQVVGWLGAVQAQDYYGAKWALAQRLKRATDASIERAYDAGAILRTHVLRPTWHFVLPADIRWLLALTAPRVKAAMRYYDRQLELGGKELARAYAAISGELRGGKHRTRAELGRVLADSGIAATGQRLGHVLMHAELDALICSGARRGKQLTYALLEERAAPSPARTRAQALTELTLRYFTSHGPALPQDFAWWSGLTLSDARAGLESAEERLTQLTIEGRTYWHAGTAKPPSLRGPVVHYLPNYDEHVIAYKERSAAFDRERIEGVGMREGVLANHLITLDGRVIGGWRRTQAKVETTLIARLNPRERKALTAARARLAQFLAS